MKTKQELFSELIDTCLPMFRQTAFRILGNAADADDAVQEALLRAWQKFGLFSSRSKMSSWVCRITINTSYDILRKRKQEKEKLQQYDPDSNTAQEHAQTTALFRALEELPEKYRTALTAVYLCGLSGEEAAQIQSCNISAHYWRISRGKEMLYKKLKGL